MSTHTTSTATNAATNAARSTVTTRDGAPDATGTHVVTVDQATGKELARHPVAGPERVAAAVGAAAAVAEAWWDLGFEGRAAHLRAWRRDIARGGEEIAALIHAENGKSVEDGRAEVLAILGHLTFVIDNAERVLGRRDVAVPPTMAHQRAWVEYLPHGVVGVIGPWNFPLGTPGAIVVHALAAGNAVILKPSELTPGVGEWLARSWARAVPDLPEVFQSLVGYAATGRALVAAGVDKVAFTGSVRSGRAVAADCAPRLTPLLLELGGNDGVVVAEDADLDLAAAHITWGALQNAGLGCISLEVAYVVDAVHDALVARIAELAGRVRAGSADGDLIGPIPLPSQIPVVRRHVEDAIARGATPLVGGPGPTDDRYVQPTVLVDVPADALAATEETFGPVLSIVRVRDTDEAISLINEGPYGLGSAVFSRERGEDIARRLRVGMTSVNDALAFSQVSGLPFGGRGDSGYGRKHGDEGLLEFVYPHAITVSEGPAAVPTTTFDRPPGAMAAALGALTARLLAEEGQR
ncbi:aldehyde dehydrogenase family protein [Streptomyces radicis]|uniref:Aldehyde dehydrogenase family protein n=1 Tax=Streptomyces radicis TaxID=1750517 RepID=A0A3A9VT44_9ACTN|nr:aldehyde dehydrogenase family protein [Streptomyces radicis]RKN04251.1 aldehyde dehydrogenase family protein [Streptomyces radicis]RKN14769.1 aldehyde dehydrogenase family protein [Streptomyces radicis]